MKSDRAKYPNSLGKDKYITVLSNEYLDYEKHPKCTSFSAELIAAPIKTIVGIINYNINEYESYKMQLLRINKLKQMQSSTEMGEHGLSQGMISILYFLNQQEVALKIHVEGKGISLPNQEDMPKYLEFVANATSRIINDICAATEAKIPHAAKIEYQRWINEGREGTDTISSGEQTAFVEKLEKEGSGVHGKKLFTSMVSGEGEKESSSNLAKKKRVTFEDEGVKKKIVLLEGENDSNVNDVEHIAVADNMNGSNKSMPGNEGLSEEKDSIGESEQNEKEEINHDEKAGAHQTNEKDSSALLNPELTQLYAWLADLPEWLQKQILNLAPVQALIEEAHQVGDIYDIKFSLQSFAEIISLPQNTNNESGCTQNIARESNQDEGLVEVNLILDANSMPFAAIIHDSVPAFADILPEPMANWLV